MARRKDHTPEELTELILHQVIEFLQDHPAEQLSLRKLAKMVGYSPGTLINLFGSYSHLILAANARTLDQILDQLASGMSGESSAEAKLAMYAQNYLEFAQAHPYQWQILFEHHLDEDEEIPEWQWQRIEKLFGMLEACLSELKPSSTSQEQHEAARLIYASVHGICALTLDDKLFAANTVDPQSMIHSLLSHYLTSWKQS